MILYPAIDIMDARAVRLVKGDFDAKKVYAQEPLSAASQWVAEGARHLHVVDLDGARTGHPVNLQHLQAIASELQVPVQFGGGLRSAEAIDGAIRAGASRVILGTAALENRRLLSDALTAHGPERVLVSVDVREGKATTAGWTQSTAMSAGQVFEALAEIGVTQFVYTNVDRDGMLEGPDIEEIAAVAQATEASLIYSGGIGALEDLQRLSDLGQSNLAGVIVGKALYEGRFTIAQAHAALER